LIQLSNTECGGQNNGHINMYLILIIDMNQQIQYIESLFMVVMFVVVL